MAARSAWFFVVLFVFSASFIYCEDGNTEAVNEETKETGSNPKVKETGGDEKVKDESGVLILTDKNFDNVINNHSLILVEFYTPWCGHCKALAPEYATAAQKLQQNDPPVPLGKIDCTTETKLADRFQVQGYPTLKIFKDGVAVDYEGPREALGIVKFMKERADPNWKPPPPAVIVLTNDNFTEITNREEIMLVEFYAPRCGHCKNLEPELEKAAQDLIKREKAILIAKIDATTEIDLAEKHNITGYPTMFIYRNGKSSEYKGPRESAGISEYMISHSGLPTKLYSTLAAVKEFLTSNFDEPVMLGVFESEDDPMFQLFVDANNEIRDDYVFGHTFSKDAKKFIGLKKSAIVVAHPEYLVSKYEPRYQIYQDESGSPTEVQEFYKKHHVPLVGHYQQHIDGRFSKRPLVLVFYDVNFKIDYRSMTQFWRKKLLEVAKEYPDFQFAVAEEIQFLEKLKEFGLSESGEDVNVGLYDEFDRKYAMLDEEFSGESLIEFLESYKSGKLKPIIKSQPVPAKVKPGKVQPVVGLSFDEIVMDESKEVFIEFYAPWCGHCQAIENSIVELAKKFKGEKDIVIAKIDGTANEAPSQYKVEGFPTIYYALPGQKTQPIKLEGERNPEALNKFIENNSEILKKKMKKEEL